MVVLEEAVLDLALEGVAFHEQTALAHPLDRAALNEGVVEPLIAARRVDVDAVAVGPAALDADPVHLEVAHGVIGDQGHHVLAAGHMRLDPGALAQQAPSSAGIALRSIGDRVVHGIRRSRHDHEPAVGGGPLQCGAEGTAVIARPVALGSEVEYGLGQTGRGGRLGKCSRGEASSSYCGTCRNEIASVHCPLIDLGVSEKERSLPAPASIARMEEIGSLTLGSDPTSSSERGRTSGAASMLCLEDW